MRNLKNLNFGVNEVLQRNQMKGVLGGEGQTSLTLEGTICPSSSCSNNSECTGTYDGCFDYICDDTVIKRCGKN